MSNVVTMLKNVRFSGKGVGGLHDTFRVVNRRRVDIHKQPTPSGGNILAIGLPHVQKQTMSQKQTMRKRKSSGGGVKQPYKKKVKTNKRTVTSTRRRSNKGRKRVVGGKKTKKRTVKRARDRF